jgi:hypothetical protein
VRRRARRAHVLSGRLFAGALGEDNTLTAAPPVVTPDAIEVLNKRTLDILKRLDDDAKARKYALMIGAASALFAAVKLGLIAFPAIRARVKT